MWTFLEIEREEYVLSTIKNKAFVVVSYVCMLCSNYWWW